LRLIDLCITQPVGMLSRAIPPHRVRGLGKGFGFRGWGFGFRVEGFVCGVWGLGFRV